MNLRSLSLIGIFSLLCGRFDGITDGGWWQDA
jgi:hypothetical protein